MFDQNILIFTITIVVGLAILLLGFKFSHKTRKVVETIGAILFHVGVFGILYHKVNINIFISLVALVVSLFILIDPLKIGNYLNAKIYRLVGYVFLFASVAFSLEYFSGFFVYLWAIPLVIYLLPYLISPLRKYSKTILFMAWLVVISYVVMIGYSIYVKYYPSSNLEIISKYMPIKSPTEKEISAKTAVQVTTEQQIETNVVPDTTTPTIVKTPPPPIETAKQNNSQLSGPYLNSLKQADEKYLIMQNNYNDLQKLYDELKKENDTLKKEIKFLKDGASAPE